MVRIAYATPTDAISMDWRAKIKLEFLRRIMLQLMMDKLRFESLTQPVFWRMAWILRKSRSHKDHRQTPWGQSGQ